MVNSGNVWMTTGGIFALCREKCLDDNRGKVCMATGCMVMCTVERLLGKNFCMATPKEIDV
jgi:hypothetical protein